MSDVIERLQQKEKIIRDLQQKKARQEGQKAQLMQQLKSELQVETVEEALAILDGLQTEVESNDRELVAIDSEMDQIIKTAQGQQPQTGSR